MGMDGLGHSLCAGDMSIRSQPEDTGPNNRDDA
jgi:hypothetical protein